MHVHGRETIKQDTNHLSMQTFRSTHILANQGAACSAQYIYHNLLWCTSVTSEATCHIRSHMSWQKPHVTPGYNVTVHCTQNTKGHITEQDTQCNQNDTHCTHFTMSLAQLQTQLTIFILPLSTHTHIANTCSFRDMLSKVQSTLWK